MSWCLDGQKGVIQRSVVQVIFKEHTQPSFKRRGATLVGTWLFHSAFWRKASESGFSHGSAVGKLADAMKKDSCINLKGHQCAQKSFRVNAPCFCMMPLKIMAVLVKPRF